MEVKAWKYEDLPEYTEPVEGAVRAAGGIRMRRKDREVTDFAEVTDILRRCDTLCIGISGEEHPYVVPVSFGLTSAEDGMPVVWFHCARQGHKSDLLSRHPVVCIEGHIFHKTEKTAHGITTRYESVIGSGVAGRAEGEEILTGLKSITDHYGFADYPLERCKGLAATAVYKIELRELTGKRNPAE